MKLSDHDLQQMHKAWLLGRSFDELLHLSESLLDDLKEARERINQNPTNSSVPSGSEPVWASTQQNTETQDDEADELEDSFTKKEQEENSESDKQSTEETLPKDQQKTKSDDSTLETPEKRKPGRQEGSAGFGRTQPLPVTREEEHHSPCCAVCGKERDENTSSRAYTGFYAIDIEWGQAENPGIQVNNVKHLYFDDECSCGHINRTQPHREPPEAHYEKIELTQWRLVGDNLSALIVFLHLRMRMSRQRIREFLLIWLGISLAVGTINQCIHEAGRAVAPLEEQLIEEIVNSDLLHGDETGWLLKGNLLWLWVFLNATTVLYYIAPRSKVLVDSLLKDFAGWLMSDGYRVYRRIEHRLRCWPHLERKAKGLAESLNDESKEFGRSTLKLLKTLMDAVYQAREGPPNPGDLTPQYTSLLEEFRRECELMRNSEHKKTHALAVEFLSDWDAIFRVLRHPYLPLTNNEAERALRHWVIYRKITYGNRTPQGAKVFTMLASVTDTCRLRNACPWRYLASVINARRAGKTAPTLPAMMGV